MSEGRPGFQNRIGYHATLLGGFTILATVLLIVSDIATRDAIAQQRAEDMQASISQVVLPELYDNNLLRNRVQFSYRDKPIQVYRGTRNGKVTALAYLVSEYGYSGEIVLMMGVDPDGKILGVRVLSHSETPGLGDKIEIEKSDWIKSFDGLSLSLPSKLWAVKKDGGQFDQLTGATITPRAIVKAIRSGLEFFKRNRSELIVYAPDEKPETDTKPMNL